MRLIKPLMSHLLFLVSCLLYIVGCASKDVQPPIEPLSPEEVGQSVSRLATQSFEFIIKFDKPDMKGSIKGITTNGRAKVEGVWEFDGDKEKFIGIGIGEKEYKFENGKWEVGQRTHHTDPVATLELVCSMGGYKFKRIEGESFLYEFDSNLLFMDPGLFGTSTRGVLWINAKTRLPQKVVAEAENIRWEFEVKNVIREKYHIFSPLAELQSIKVTAEVPTTDELIRISQILKERFELYGFDEVNYELKETYILLKFLSETVDKDLLQNLTQPGKLELYKATYPTGSINGAHFVAKDPTKPIFLCEHIDCKVVTANFYPGVLGTRTKPIIELIFDKDLPEDERIAVVMDGEVIAVVPKAWGNRFKIEANKIAWIKIKLPLPCKVNIKM